MHEKISAVKDATYMQMKKRKPEKIQTRFLLAIFVSTLSPLALNTHLLPFSGMSYVSSQGNAFCSEIPSMNCIKIHTISSFYSNTKK